MAGQKKNLNTFDVNDLLCEYLTTKVDKYDNEISYYKVIDKNFKQKMSSILKEQNEECRMHFWKTDDGEYILKVKKKFTPKIQLEQGDIITTNLRFKYYAMQKDDDKLLQGYYLKITYEEDKENNNN